MSNRALLLGKDDDDTCRVVGANISERLLKVFKPIKLSSEGVAPTTLDT